MTIEIIEAPAPTVTKLKVQLLKAQGWMAFGASSVNAPQMWMQVIPAFVNGQVRDTYRCPWPLFENRAEAIAAAEKTLPNGGIVKLFKVEL